MSRFDAEKRFQGVMAIERCRRRCDAEGLEANDWGDGVAETSRKSRGSDDGCQADSGNVAVGVLCAID